MIKLKTATLLLVFACTFFCVCDSSAKTGKNYYVDALQGNDDANGLSKQTAWKSLERLKDIQLRAGIRYVFEEGSFLTAFWNSQRREGDKRVLKMLTVSVINHVTTHRRFTIYNIVAKSDYLTLQNLDVVILVQNGWHTARV